MVLDSPNSCGVAVVESRRPIPADWEDWLGTSFRGRVEYQRRFGLPTQLEPGQAVWLVLEAVDYEASISLNEIELGSMRLGDNPFRVDIRNRLQHSNHLKVVIDLPAEAERGERNSAAGGLIGSVRLEIATSL
jgi:beta-galactosidase/beta-glucuronidase